MPKKGEYIDLTGQKFGKLTAIRYAGQAGRRSTRWLCRCECGKEVIVSTGHLRSGHSKSCGCLSLERIKQLNYKTGLYNTRLYRVYRNMMNRCYWEKSQMYHRYGARGIGVCEEWRDKEDGFKNFSEWALLNGYSEKLSIDRIDNDKDYSAENCRWVDAYMQANNKSNNRLLKVNGEIDTVGNWARRTGANYWNLMHYANGGRNMKYPYLEVEAVDERICKEKDHSNEMHSPNNK